MTVKIKSFSRLTAGSEINRVRVTAKDGTLPSRLIDSLKVSRCCYA